MYCCVFTFAQHIYPKSEISLIQSFLILAKLFLCSRWPVRTFAECILYFSQSNFFFLNEYTDKKYIYVLSRVGSLQAVNLLKVWKTVHVKCEPWMCDICWIVCKNWISSKDPDGGNITYSLISGHLPPGNTLNMTTGEITGRAPDIDATYTFGIRATDTHGKYADGTYSISVRGTNLYFD